MAGVSVATQLVELVEKKYAVGITPTGEPYAVPKDGPCVVRLLRGGRGSLRADIASAFYENTGSAAASGALADALAVVEGKANQADPVDLHMRVAQVDGSVILDLGDPTGRCVVIDRNRWVLRDSPPEGVLFKRTALTGALPVPKHGGDITKLWKALNVAEKSRPLVLSVLVSMLLPGIPHPVVLITGEHGTGKTSACARLSSIMDPSPAQVRKAPRDQEAWTTAAAGSWVVALDNLSDIPAWLSDAICRASTGDGDVRRRLYADGDLYVIAFRRVVILNGIDVGAVRGDLADRLVHLVLELIPDTNRRKDAAMARAWRDAHPDILGGLLDLTVQALGRLPTVRMERLPRMADFAEVVKAVDLVRNTNGLDDYLGLRDEMAEDAATSDPVLVALGKYITEEWKGTSAELLAKLSPKLGPAGVTWKPPKDWPESARELTTTMTRQAPTLRQLGWGVVHLDRNATRERVVRWELKPPPKPGDRSWPGNHAADAADAAPGPFSHVKRGVDGAASTAASAAATDPDECGNTAGAA